MSEGYRKKDGDFQEVGYIAESENCACFHMDTDLEWVSKQETATQVEGISYASHLQACPPAVFLLYVARNTEEWESGNRSKERPVSPTPWLPQPAVSPS